MIKFNIKFYYNTDLRYETVIEAFDSVRALVKAYDEMTWAEWVTRKEMKVEITCID